MLHSKSYNSGGQTLRCFLLLGLMCRVIARDIGGSDPERMSAPLVADYIEKNFRGTPVHVSGLSIVCLLSLLLGMRLILRLSVEALSVYFSAL